MSTRRYAPLPVLESGLEAALLAAPVQAGEVTLQPSSVAVGPTTGQGESSVAIQFDLTKVPDLATYRIDEVRLDWPLTGISGEAVSEYDLYPATASWTARGVSGGTLPALADAPAASWSWGPLAAARNPGGAFLRFNVTNLLRAWATGVEENHGVVILSPDLGAEGLAGQTGAIALTVRYSLRP